MSGWDWSLKDLKDVKKNGLKVFSCFSCGGGSSMGYKLTGFDLLGNVEIDPQMMKIYRKNHNPKYPFLMGVQDFKKIPNEELPKELFDLDILDGSPPCSAFSMAGSREKSWGVKKKFREGQAEQNLDDLFFEFLDVVAKLNPKVVVAENVKGLVQGKAKGYVKLIVKRFKKLGYKVQIFLLNAASMGVPQKRERVFFIAHRKELGYPKLKLVFDDKPITYGEIKIDKGKPINKDTKTYVLWTKRKGKDKCFGDITKREEGKASWFNAKLIKDNMVCNTIASGGDYFRMDIPYRISDMDIIRISTFPRDYNFLDTDVKYVCGMSVPPVMMKKISEQIYLQWFKS